MELLAGESHCRLLTLDFQPKRFFPRYYPELQALSRLLNYLEIC